MFQTPRTKQTVTVIGQTDRNIGSLVAALEAHPDIAAVSHYPSLGEAYAPTEASPPNIVVCTRAVSAAPEFFMFGALAKMLGLRMIVVEADGAIDAVCKALGLQSVARAPSNELPIADAASRAQRLVAIGASTGGIEALSKVLSGFPALCPPTVIVQHIKADFLEGVVHRLDNICDAQVRVASEGDALVPGRIFIAPGNTQHLVVTRRGARCELRDGPPFSGHRPSVDRLFESVAPLGAKAVGVLLTGMGRDGATGLGAMRRAGAWTIAQDAESSTVYGMPRVARDEGAVCETVSLARMAKSILTASRPAEAKQ